MTAYRTELPQLSDDLFIADGGIETTLIFQEGQELPDFAAFHLLRTPAGTAALRRYFETYASLAARLRLGVVLETATWRASADWALRLGYTASELEHAIRKSVRLLEEIRSEAVSSRPVVISGCIGPRGDGYTPSSMMSAAQAEEYHRREAEILADTEADMLSAITMNYVEEAVGVVRCAAHVGMPVAVSFTVETDGRLATGESLESAIERVDAATGAYASYYMINCAHPAHFEDVLSGSNGWAARIRGVRANASRMSHAELNDATELHAGDPVELASDYVRLKERLPNLNVMGGCCGTDHRHVEQIARTCAPLFPVPSAGAAR